MNIKSIKNANRSSVLYLLNTYKSLSRKEIATKLNLTPAAVTKICQSLIEDGYIIEGETVDSLKSGRREILLSLNLSDKFVLGINAEKDNITYSYSSLSGKLIYSKTTSFEDNIKNVVENLRAFVYNKNIDTKNIFAIGVCVIGSIGDDDFTVWKNSDIKTMLEKEFSSPVVVENNVKAFAQSELIYGNPFSTDSLLFLKWGPGIGSSIVANGKVFSGNDNGIAEIGHYIVDVSGERCRCGRFGCLETVASTDALMKEIGRDFSLDEIINSKNKDIINIIDHKIDLVALSLTNTATILNTDNILLFGNMFKSKDIADKLIKQCIRYNSNMKHNNIRVSSLNDYSAYIGSTAIAAKHFYFEREV